MGKTFHCGNCGRTFTDKRTLDDHVKKAHKQPSPQAGRPQTTEQAKTTQGS